MLFCFQWQTWKQTNFWEPFDDNRKCNSRWFDAFDKGTPKKKHTLNIWIWLTALYVRFWKRWRTYNNLEMLWNIKNMQYGNLYKLVWKTIPNFGVSTVILNPLDIFRRWWKLNFGPMKGQVKSRHFSEGIVESRQYLFTSYKNFLE